MSKSKLFTTTPRSRVTKNYFDLSHEVKVSGKFGYLYPMLLMDVLPGDVVNEQMSVFVRSAPLLAPILHRCDIKAEAFFVPNRLLTDHWQDFVTGGQDGTLSPVLPYIWPGDVEEAILTAGSLWDYFGLPPWDGVSNRQSTEQISALPFFAYAKIWNDWYRDPNLDVEIDIPVDLEGDVSSQFPNPDGSPQLGSLCRRGFEKDYFTSSLPFAQRGPQVLMPLAGSGTVTYLDKSRTIRDVDDTPIDGTVAGGTFGADSGILTINSAAGRIENIDSVEIDASSVSINDLRRSLALQRWSENNARGGGRYIEQLEGHFNERVPDYRLQRSELLGFHRQALQISEVLATAESTGVDVGDMKGHGISVGKSNRWSYKCPEHGFVIVMLSIIPRTAYSQGIPRLWSRRDKFDFAFPELAHIGEQEVLSKEVFYSFDVADEADNQEVFGYIPRFAEYKFMQDRIAGDFRSTLGFWHLSRNFTSRPVLDSDFTTMYEDGGGKEETFRRIFAVQDGTDYFWMQIFHKLFAKRPLPYFGVPSI